MSDNWRILPIACPPNVTVRGIRFAMQDQGQLVDVLVTHAALDRVEPPNVNGSDYLDRFGKHRESFERVANDKFVRNAIEDDGSIVVLVGDLKA